MKKVLYFATLLLCMAFVSCQKEEIGGTATENLAGEWYVQANVVENGEVIEDPYGNFKVKATADPNGLTFSASSAQNQRGDEITVNITNGKINKNGGAQNNGSPADYITMDVEFSDDPGTIYRLEGVRYSGLVEND